MASGKPLLKPSQVRQNRSGRAKLPKSSTVRNKADNLLTPIIKAMYPYCLLGASQNYLRVTVGLFGTREWRISIQTILQIANWHGHPLANHQELYGSYGQECFRGI